jgi:hypothetical protein
MKEECVREYYEQLSTNKLDDRDGMYKFLQRHKLPYRTKKNSKCSFIKRL